MNKKEIIDLFSHTPPRASRRKLASPVEELFITSLEKYLAPGVAIYPQYSVSTPHGAFRLDFVLTLNHERIAVECAEAEVQDEWKDEWRDAVMLGTGRLKCVYRFRGKDIYSFIDDCIFMLYYYERKLFSSRYAQIYRGLISEEMREYEARGINRDGERNQLYYPVQDEDGEITDAKMLLVERRCAHAKGNWRALQAFAGHHTGLKLPALMKLYGRQRSFDW